ncbi:MAG: translation elongation factor Ts [Chloroflexi bacterium]|nr:translation elongation factor Ts [Chloroflexota bacterium]
MEPSSEAVCKAGNINHVAIIVKDIEETLKFYQETFGLGDAPIEEIPDQGVRAALIPIGGTHLELIQPVRPDTGVARFLEARGEAFQALVKDIAMHIAATGPAAVKREDLDPSIIDEERKVFRAQAQDQGKPEKIVDKIVEGRIDKFYREICLLEQPFVKDTDKTVDDVVKEAIATIGENISVRRFTRYELGEGLEKRTEDFAEEVAKVAAKN